MKLRKRLALGISAAFVFAALALGLFVARLPAPHREKLVRAREWLAGKLP